MLGLAHSVVVRTDGEPDRATALVRAEVAALDRDQPLSDIRSLESTLDDYMCAGPRFGLTLFAVFAVLGLTLAVVGVYGVIAHAVSRRTQEIGVRMALGATTDRIVSMVVAAVLMVVGLQATLWPALRVTRVNPVAALRKQ